jgi:outer membrane biosynthesis protein TonB
VRRNFLVYGIGISIALHALVLPFLHAEKTLAEEPAPDHMVVDHIPTPPPTPPPTPRPTAQPTPPPREQPHTPPSQAPRLRIIPPSAVSRNGGVSEPGNTHPDGDPNGKPADAGIAPPAAGATTASPAATTPPTPRPTPTPLSCARPEVPAATVRTVEPDTPALALQQGVSGTVNVVVSLDAQSRIVATRVASSPSALLNGAALATARGSQFRTGIHNCEPVAADYIFSVEFTAQ